MQFSTNCDEAIRLEIRSAPSLAGQYRKARLIINDRQYALDQWSIDHEKSLLEIQKFKIFAEIKRAAGSPVGEIEARQIELDIRKIELSLAQSARLIEDAEREKAAAIREMIAINQQAGVDFEQLPIEEYQAQMGSDLHDRKLRNIMASIYAVQSGIPPAVFMDLMELPPESLARYTSNINRLSEINPLLGAIDAAALVGDDNGDR
ncbi:MAG: hypothetical protein ACRC62_32115 [Microcoleus sp.]